MKVAQWTYYHEPSGHIYVESKNAKIDLTLVFGKGNEPSLAEWKRIVYKPFVNYAPNTSVEEHKADNQSNTISED